MLVYYINLVLILGLAWPLCIHRPSKPKTIAYLVITFGYMWFLATFRLNIGFDYGSYLRIFNEVAETGSLMEAIRQQPFEPGFVALNYLLKPFVYDAPVLYGIYSALIFIPVGIFIYQNCKDAWLSTWMYVTLAYFYSSMNFVRANIACGISLLGYKFLRERKPIPYFIIILLASTIHRTALIMIPLYFLSLIPLNWKSGLAYGVLTITGAVAAPWLVNDVLTNYAFASYKDSIFTTNGLSLIFLMVPTTILVACLALYPVWKRRDPAATTLLYMAIFSWIIWLAGTRVFILERFSHYAYLLMLVALPSALSALKAAPEDYQKLAALESQSGGSHAKKGPKEARHEVVQLRQKISDHQKYYWAAVIAVLIVTIIYNEFGMHVNNFHDVFPYQSVLW